MKIQLKADGRLAVGKARNVNSKVWNMLGIGELPMRMKPGDKIDWVDKDNQRDVYINEVLIEFTSVESIDVMIKQLKIIKKDISNDKKHTST